MWHTKWQLWGRGKRSVQAPSMPISPEWDGYLSGWGSLSNRTDLGGLLASATSIGGKDVQQDACGCLDLPGCKIAAVADGISSSPRAHLAASTAIHVVLNGLVQRWQAGCFPTRTVLAQIFTEAQRAIHLQAQARNLTQPSPATTLILGVELADRLLLAYVGDGAAVLTTGSLQWMQNLLYPQVGPAGAIVRYLGDPQAAIEPGYIELPKVWPEGCILLIGTDGALVQGQTLSTAEAILGEVQRQVMDSTAKGRTVDPHGILEAWISQRLSTSDNRSLALIVSEQALRLWQDLGRRQQAKAQAGGGSHATQRRLESAVGISGGAEAETGRGVTG
jgi:serine/threonine protein phosphatase PrpC